MIYAPHTYSEWSQVLNILKNKTDDQEVLAAMKNGTIEWQSGVASRFAAKLIDTINSRMNEASDKFQKDMNHAGGQEGAIVQALLSMRRELRFLTDAIDLPAIPDQDRQQYVAMVRGQADRVQSSLEESAKKDRSGKMASIVRRNKVNAF